MKPASPLRQDLPPDDVPFSLSPTSPADVPMQSEPAAPAEPQAPDDQAPADREPHAARASPSGVEELSRAFAANLHMAPADLPPGPREDACAEGQEPSRGAHPPVRLFRGLRLETVYS